MENHTATSYQFKQMGEMEAEGFKNAVSETWQTFFVNNLEMKWGYNKEFIDYRKQKRVQH